jgi:hypothetical protein
MAIDTLLLVSPETLYLRHFYIKVPPISDTNWKTVPVDDAKKCEALLLIGKYVLEASLVCMVYKEIHEAPLTGEVSLLSTCFEET